MSSMQRARCDSPTIALGSAQALFTVAILYTCPPVALHVLLPRPRSTTLQEEVMAARLQNVCVNAQMGKLCPSIEVS